MSHCPMSCLKSKVLAQGKTTRRATTDEHGRFKISHVPAGTYKFKATLNGFQSVVGTINISNKSTTENEIRLEMQVGV
jgi:hypothetical protein